MRAKLVAIGDLVIILSVIASLAAIWFRWSSARAGRRALALFRANAPDREPGLALETIGTSMREGAFEVEIRLTNPAGAGNVVTALYLKSAGKLLPAVSGDGAFNVPFVIQAHGAITGHITFRVRDESLHDGTIVVIDIDGRHVSSGRR